MQFSFNLDGLSVFHTLLTIDPTSNHAPAAVRSTPVTQSLDYHDVWLTSVSRKFVVFLVRACRDAHIRLSRFYGSRGCLLERWQSRFWSVHRSTNYDRVASLELLQLQLQDHLSKYFPLSILDVWSNNSACQIAGERRRHRLRRLPRNYKQAWCDVSSRTSLPD